MSPDGPVVSFLVITHRRAAVVIEAIESVLTQDYPNKEVVVIVSPAGDTYQTVAARFEDVDAVTVEQEQSRRGVAAARNEAFEAATGDILVIFDDDAVFDDQSAAKRIVETFEDNRDVGALAFRSEGYDSGQVILPEIPRGPAGKMPDQRYRTTYFVGVGAAFRRSAIERTTGFPDEFFYYMEELDLSFQLLENGFEILYVPEIVVRHRGEGDGRPELSEQWRLTLENRIRVSIRHLPLRYVLVSAIVWTGYVLYRTGGSIGAVLTAYRNVLADRNALAHQRTVISAKTRRRLGQLNGRLWY